MSKSKQEKRRSVRSRTLALTRKQEMAELHRRKDTALAEEVSRRLMPAIQVEVSKQINELSGILKDMLDIQELPEAVAARKEAEGAPRIVTP